jgi:hypothetical protein
LPSLDFLVLWPLISEENYLISPQLITLSRFLPLSYSQLVSSFSSPSATVEVCATENSSRTFLLWQKLAHWAV